MRIFEVLRQIELEEDVYRFGLSGTIDPVLLPDTAEAVLAARSALVERLKAEGAEDLVVRFSADSYNTNATLAENILFGTPKKPEFETAALSSNPLMVGLLDEMKLTDELLAMGMTIAKTMVEIFADLPPGHPFFEQFSFISDDDLPEFRILVARGENQGLAALNKDERRRLLGLPFLYIESRHRLGLIEKAMEARVVDARQKFAARLQDSDPDAVEFYRADAYNAAAALQDNILFGRIAHGQAQAEETVGKAVTEVLTDMGLRDTIVEVGLDYQVGVGGKRLSAVQRQKLGLARALIKQPDILVVNEALAVMDGATQSRLMGSILESRSGRGVVWTLQRPSMADHFERLVVMKGGRVIEQGEIDELRRPGSLFNEMLAAE